MLMMWIFFSFSFYLCVYGHAAIDIVDFIHNHAHVHVYTHTFIIHHYSIHGTYIYYIYMDQQSYNMHIRVSHLWSPSVCELSYLVLDWFDPYFCIPIILFDIYPID